MYTLKYMQFHGKFSEIVSFYNQKIVKKFQFQVFCEICQIFRLSLGIKDSYSYKMRHSRDFYLVYWRNYSEKSDVDLPFSSQ